MKLTSLITENFKRLRDFSCTFTDGLNTIIGDNAAGKTTLLQAVVVALYGPSAVPGKVEDLTTWGQKGFKIRLTFEHEGQQYHITRDAKNARIESDGGMKASGNTVCTKFIEELLGLSFKDFLLFVLSQQGETAGVLTYGATALQKRVETFSGADLIDRVLTKVRGEIAILDRNLKDQNLTELEATVAQHALKLKLLQGQIETEHSAAETLQGEIDLAEKELSKRRAELKHYIQVANSLNLIQSKVQGLNEQIESTEAVLTSALATKVNLPELPEAASLEDELRDTKADLSKYRQTLKAANDTRQQYENLMARRDALVPEVRAVQAAAGEAAELRETLKPLSAYSAELKEKVDGFRSSVKDLQQALKEGVCRSCNRPFDDHDPEAIKTALADTQLDLERAEIAWKDHQTQLNVVEKALLNAERRANSNAEAQFNTVVAELEALNDEVAAISDEMIQLLQDNQVKAQARIQELEKQLEGAEDLIDQHRRADTHINRTRDKLNQLVETRDAHLAESDKTADEYEKLNPSGQADEVIVAGMEEVINDLSTQNTERIRRVRAHTGTLQELQTEARYVQRDFDTASKYLSRAAEVSASLDKHRRLARFLSESRTTYLKQVWDQILGVASAKVAISTQGRIRRIHRDEKGDFVAEEEGKWVPIANCSGAQKAHIGVAMRVGLSASLYGTAGTLILDEPTDAMNDTNALNLAGSLMGLGGQCLMITHRSYEQLAAQNVIAVG